MNPDERINVIGIGCQRCGSTWIFRTLEAHPDVTTAARANNKELNFFNDNYAKGYGWYHDLFESTGGNCAEFSVGYWYHSDVPERIHRYNSEAKLILSLRDPIERAYSQHKHQFRRGRLNDRTLDFERAMDENPSYVEQGLYATHLKRYLDSFNFESIKIILLEDITDRPESTVKTLYDFLDLDTSVTPDHLDEQVNRSKSFRSSRLKELRFWTADTLRSTLGDWSVELIKKTTLPGLLKTLNERSPESSLKPPNKQTLERLRDRFQPEVRELETLIGRDLSRWLNPSFKKP